MDTSMGLIHICVLKCTSMQRTIFARTVCTGVPFDHAEAVPFLDAGTYWLHGRSQFDSQTVQMCASKFRQCNVSYFSFSFFAETCIF